MPFTTADFFLVKPKMSMQKLTRFSNTPMTVVTAAKLRNTKKRVPQKLPAVMLAKMLGSETKTRPGPAAGATL